MEAEETKAQEESPQINGLEQKGELGVASTPSEGKEREAPGEGGEAEAAKKEGLGESQEGRTDASAESGRGQAAVKEAQVDNEPARETSGSVAVQECETGEKEKAVRGGNQAEMEEDRVAVGVSGTEPKEEADVSGTPKGEEGKADAPSEKNTSISSREGRTGSTSDEPLSPKLEEEEEECWPEFSPSSPDESPQSPTGFKCSETGDTTSAPSASEAAAGDTTSPVAAPEKDQKQQQQQPSPTEGEAASTEKKKRPTFDRRELTRPRMPPRAQSRKAIVEKFGGAASGPAPNIKKTGGANTVKNMLLEWCQAKTGAMSMSISRTSLPAGVAEWPSVPSSTSSSQMPLTTLNSTRQSGERTLPWLSPLPSGYCFSISRYTVIPTGQFGAAGRNDAPFYTVNPCSCTAVGCHNHTKKSSVEIVFVLPIRISNCMETHIVFWTRL
ncbi:hypothetical protein JRQ81_000123 [Phrynocephalus forsythii]|uniref:Smoothelin-like protein 1 n=1 Tax=Phrynocephalus forsythii TaxID=171643 RepID=A0A9Q0Y863_9SAUR|nr:hypothetical protein JRQ81_000123 [Phrynocephalus forsythii]